MYPECAQIDEAVHGALPLSGLLVPALREPSIQPSMGELGRWGAERRAFLICARGPVGRSKGSFDPSGK
jgi:hypothetical protein